MSFILDALRKSENERQQGAVPGISHVPFAVPHRRLPGWALTVIVVLGIGVLLLGGAWWKSSRSEPEVSTAAAKPAPTVNVPIEIPGPSPVERLGAAAAARTPNGVATRSLADLTEPHEAVAPNRASEPTVTEESVADEAAAPRSANAWQTLPTAAELNAKGIAIPQLRLELHVYYRDRPVDRFVIINGSKYREGEVTAQGPRVVTIESTGAVLSHQGREFLLSPE